MPKIDKSTISLKDKIVEKFKKITKHENVLSTHDELKPYETDALSAYKQKPLAVIFPENTQEGFDTEALLTIWDEKDDFNALMQKASVDMIKLTSVIGDAEDIRGTLKQFMWSNCKACHSRYREEH